MQPIDNIAGATAAQADNFGIQGGQAFRFNVSLPGGQTRYDFLPNSGQFEEFLDRDGKYAAAVLTGTIVPVDVPNSRVRDS